MMPKTALVTQEPALRRTPRQSRGQRRIALILDAAERLFAEHGYDTVTTNAIAARAGTAIGSLYQYFPNKEAILVALVARFQEQMRAAFDAALDSAERESLDPLGALLDRVLDPLLALHARRAPLLHVFFRLPRMGEPASAAAQLTEEIIGRLDGLVAARVPWMDPAKRRLHVLMVVEAVKGLLPLTANADGTQRPEVIAELKRMLRAYMSVVLAERLGGDVGSGKSSEMAEA